MAPECFWRAYLPASDVFSAGVVLYRMVTGDFPWDYDFDAIRGQDPDSMADRGHTYMHVCSPMEHGL